MYNLNVNVNPSPTGAAGLLGVTAAAAEVTPRTPEIVNSLIAMTNPFEGYGSGNEKGMRDRTDSTSSGEPSPPSVQHTCSQLIKEGKRRITRIFVVCVALRKSRVYFNKWKVVCVVLRKSRVYFNKWNFWKVFFDDFESIFSSIKRNKRKISRPQNINRDNTRMTREESKLNVSEIALIAPTLHTFNKCHWLTIWLVHFAQYNALRALFLYFAFFFFFFYFASCATY